MLYAAKKVGRSFSLQIVVGFFSRKTLLRWTLARKRFYFEFAPAILCRPICIFERKGFLLRDNSPSIYERSSSTGNWSRFHSLFIKQVGEDEKSRRDYFEGKDQKYATSSRIVQTEDNTVCVIGGFKPTLIAHDYDVARSCF